MPQADFAYAPAPATAALTLAVSIFGNDPAVIGQWRDDVAAAGFAIRASGSVEDLLDGDVRALGEVILVECAEMSSAACAALARLDMRAARSGAQVVIATTPAALDEVFACLDQCNPQILVNPTRADRVIALGRVLASVPNMRLREMPEDDRLMLLRLTEQVGRIAERLERLGGNTAADEGGRGNVFRFESPGQDFAGEGPQGGDRLRSARVPSPDPRLVRSVIRQRQMRAEFFDAELFADPAWDILLDLTAARAEHTRVSVTSLCIASGVPPTTALRWISQMTEAGLLERVADDADKRRVFIALTDRTADAMARYFAALQGKKVAVV